MRNQVYGHKFILKNEVLHSGKKRFFFKIVKMNFRYIFFEIIFEYSFKRFPSLSFKSTKKSYSHNYVVNVVCIPVKQ